MLSIDMSDFQTELEEAIKGSGVSHYHVNNLLEITDKIKRLYVDNNPRAWWLSLKYRSDIFSYADNLGYKDILKIAKKNNFIQENDARIFFIADEDNEKMHIYRIPINSIEYIVENCRYFEYYAVAQDLSWLICENDHGNLIMCSSF